MSTIHSENDITTDTSPSLNSAFYSYPVLANCGAALLYLLAPAGRRTLHVCWQTTSGGTAATPESAASGTADSGGQRNSRIVIPPAYRLMIMSERPPTQLCSLTTSGRGMLSQSGPRGTRTHNLRITYLVVCRVKQDSSSFAIFPKFLRENSSACDITLINF